MRTKLAAVVFAALAPGLAAADNKGGLGEVFFAFDSSQVTGDVSAKLDATVAYAALHPDSRIVLDAHCDVRGTSPYNIGLAIRRADAIRDELVARGVPDEQIVFAIYGKDGERRATFAQDRRVTLWATHDALATVIDTTLAKRGTAITWGRPLSVAEIAAPPSTVAYR